LKGENKEIDENEHEEKDGIGWARDKLDVC
jgi:hypothetical protein